jgi:hypothetical protein
MLNPDFALANGIRRKIYHILLLKKARQYLRVLPHFFDVYYMASVSATLPSFCIPNAKAGFDLGEN